MNELKKSLAKRLKTSGLVFAQAKLYYQFYIELWETKHNDLISYYSTLQSFHLFVENNLVLNLAILTESQGKHSLKTVINCLGDAKIFKTKEARGKLLAIANLDSGLINRIQTFRNKYVAHLDVNPGHPEYLNNKEYQGLLNGIEEVFKAISEFVPDQEEYVVSTSITEKIPIVTMLDHLDSYRKLLHNNTRGLLSLEGKI